MNFKTFLMLALFSTGFCLPAQQQSLKNTDASQKQEQKKLIPIPDADSSKESLVVSPAAASDKTPSSFSQDYDKYRANSGKSLRLHKNEMAKSKENAADKQDSDKKDVSASDKQDSDKKEPAIDPKSRSGETIERLKANERKLAGIVSPWRAVTALIIVGLLMFACFKILKKVSKKFNGTEAGAIKIKSRLQLDPKNSIVIVKAYEEEFLIGVGSNGVTPISRFLPIENAETETDDEEKTEPGTKKFDNSLKKAIEKSNGEFKTVGEIKL